MSDTAETATLEEVIVSPEKLEEAMVEKTLAEDPSGLPQDKAAAFFKRGAAELAILLNDMSLREMKRMIMNVATYPYLDRNYEIKRDTPEFKATYRFNEMVWQKTIMQLSVEAEKVEKAIQEGKNNNLTLNKGEENVNPQEIESTSETQQQAEQIRSNVD